MAEMFSKIKGVLTSVVLAALAFGGFSVALAASSSHGLDDPKSALSAASAAVSWNMGQITAVGSDSFTVTTPLGGQHVVYINDQTAYYNHIGQSSNFAALQVGQRVLGTASTTAGGKVTAGRVINLSIKRIHHHRRYGDARAVNSAQQSFTFSDRHGVVSEVFVDANTKITDGAGNPKTFAGIQAGMHLYVHSEKRPDGRWWALDIKLGQPQPPAATSTQS